jgi:multidrug resistance efflux pump
MKNDVKIKGDAAKVEVDAYLKKQFKGIVTSISIQLVRLNSRSN